MFALFYLFFNRKKNPDRIILQNNILQVARGCIETYCDRKVDN